MLTIDVRFIDEGFSPAEHPHAPAGSPKGGQFVKKGGGGTSAKAPQKAPPKNTAAGPSQGRASPAATLVPADDRTAWPEHIKALKVPPAWQSVKISHDPHADLLVIGHDVKGVKQYIYSKKFADAQAAKKFERIHALQKAAPKIDAQNEKNRQSDNSTVRDNADVLALILRMGLRPGSDAESSAKVKAYGATNLRKEHVVKDGDQTRLKFVGKKGVSLDLPVRDPDLAKMLQQRAKAAQPNGPLFPKANENTLLSYVHGFEGGKFKSKDFRTLLACRSAQAEIASMPVPKNPAQYKKAVREVAAKISSRLGNTPTVALQSYINPILFAEWKASAGV